MNQTVVISCAISSESALMQSNEPILSDMELNIRLAQYSKNSDATVSEVYFEYFTVNVQYIVNEGTVEITDYRQEKAAGIPAEAIPLEADCWQQAFDYFGVDTDAILEDLRQQHPGYFNLSASKGIELYWQDTPDGIRCVLTGGTNREKTDAELAAKDPLTVPEAMLILRTYDAPGVYYRILNNGTAVAVP